MRESSTVEFKREFTEDLKYAVVAFANSDGGKLYIGIEDDGRIRGVDQGEELIARVSNMIRDTVKPDVSMFVQYEILSLEEKEVLLLQVSRGTGRPYYLQGKGIRPQGVYIRQGAASVPASETNILHMIKETSGDRFEEARAINQQLTFQKTWDYFRKKEIEFGEAQLRSLNFQDEDNMYTNLAMLFSDQCVSSIKMAVFEGSKKTVFRDRREFTGSILHQLEEAYGFIHKYNRNRSEFRGLERVDRQDYPEEAIREALLNAIVHRDYAVRGSTLISIFDDRIEFVTLGGLVRGIAFSDLMLGVSVLRNERLGQILYRLKLIEAYGTGMLKIQESYQGEQRKPEIKVAENSFKVILPNRNFEHAADIPALKEKVGKYRVLHEESREEKILKLLMRKSSIYRKEVEDELSVSQATAVLLIRSLVEKGILQNVSGGKYSRYELGLEGEKILKKMIENL